jgi:phospholipid/cholesterol/gamma-HCH transport system substrate-binding protein
MINTPEFKVGALVIIVSSIIGFMSLKVSEGPGLFSRNKRYWFDIEDAGGLVKNSAVKSAGIKVGVIEDIKLVDGKARVYVVVDGELQMRKSGAVDLRSDGILGDRHVEMLPGDEKDEVLADGDQIRLTYEKGSLNSLMKEVGNISASIGELTATLNKATSGNGDRSTSLGRIVSNIEKLTQDLSEITGENKSKIGSIVGQVDSITKQLDKFLSDDSPEGFSHGWQKAIDSLSRIDRSLKNVEEITGKINRGEGTIGRLVNDEETVDKLNDAIGNVNDFLGGAGQLETSFDFHSEYLSDVSLTKSFLAVKIQPGLDRYYEIGIVDDPRGVSETKNVKRIGSPEADFEEVTTFENETKFTALFAKNFYNFTIKGGLIESSGGLGIDYYMLGRDLRFSLEAFEFDDLTVRAFARYNIMRGVYLVGGGDELTDSDLSSYFLGAGLFITNDDLKLFANKINF